MSISDKVQFRTWGIIILALWALVLALLALANILFLSTVVQFFTREDMPNLTQLWLVFILNIIFLIGFSGSAYGLLKRHNWGRILFVGFIMVWSGFNLMALFTPSFSAQDYKTRAYVLNGIYYLGGLLLPLWYLNLPRVKADFQGLSENSTTED
ncbi:MAG: hypothetical protein JW953_16435 [Anaerolineae bacterium]|nr:hypothetical protein [Anaerolineae bacterium]